MAPIVLRLLLMTLLLAGPAHLTPETPRGSEVGGGTSLREEPESFRVLVSEGCVTSGSKQEGPELELLPGSPLVLTHRISLVPSSGAVCRCQGELGRLLGRLEELEREVSALRVSCTAGGGGCCSSKESKGAGCSVQPDPESSICPGHCSDQGRCVGGACVCFHGFSGPDCSRTTCPADCSDRGRCVDGRCQCDPGYTGPDCSRSSCPGNCNQRGRCVDGRCVCDPEFSGPDCSGKSCPGDCNARGRCVDGGCVCDPEFSGPDCSEKSCPSNCNHRGRCVDGRCVCNSEFSGPDCSEKSCPGDCNARGRCVDGRCVCDPEFSGPDCSGKSCPSNCNDRGRCVDGRCVCNSEFSGPDCSVAGCRVACGRHGQCEAGRCVCHSGFTGPSCTSKSCPGNCSNRGRCVKGRCLCRGAFSGADCSLCVDGTTGPNCDQVLSAVTGLIADDITESSVTLLWTQPAVQYQTYDITFSSLKDSDQQIKAQVEGGVVHFVQTGLAPGQEYTATITGQTSGQSGASGGVKFNTSTSSPTDLRVVKTSTSSAVLQWASARGQVDRYHLTVSPSDGAGESQEIALPPERDSAHIEHLEAGRLYDVTLRAESAVGLSSAVTVKVVPGPSPPSGLVFSQVSEDSVTLTWTGPPAPVNSFKVTYTHSVEGEPMSVVVGSEESSLSLSQLSAGSTYQVSVVSVLGLDESDPIQDSVTTLPDPPTDLRLLNVSDFEALLLWRPSKATVDKYSIVYGTGKGPDLRVVVRGNAVEQQLGGLAGSTAYAVTVTGLLGDARSAAATANFTTSAGGEEEEEEEEEGPQDLRASEVTPRTALLSWKPPAATAVDRYRLTYQADGAEPEEVTLDPTATNHKLRRLRSGSSYTAMLQGERDGRQTSRLHAHFTTGVLRFPYPADCSQELLNGFGESGEAEVFPGGGQGAPLPVYCDMETDGGGWTVFQRRMDGSVDFYRGWKDYVRGFGDLGGEFWLGLDDLHNLTSGTPMSLRVDLRAGDEAVYARYSTFNVAKKNYRLTVAGYSGTAGDSMAYHNQRLFSARDRDPTPFITRCAVSYRGGWWYKNCHHANLNGLYGAGRLHQGVIWTAWKGKDFSIPWTEMKMRPSAFIPPSH